MPDIDLTLQQFAREDEEKHAQEEATRRKLPYINLVGYPITPEVLAVVPKETAFKWEIVAYLRAGNVLRLASNNPDLPGLKEELARLAQAAKLEFKISFASKTSVIFGLKLYDVLLPPKEETQGVKVKDQAEKDFAAEIKTFQDLKEKILKTSTTELLDVIFTGAILTEASDVHVEPGENDFRLRFRIDGVLQDVATLPRETFDKLLSRIKYLSHLKLDITSPQDGRFEVQAAGEPVDIRVSTLPTTFGEAVVMRLLPKNKQFVSLEGLEFNQEVLQKINQAISKPQGLILNTGPTGSGKTTTLYAMLQKLNEPGRKIITLENPIEYRVPGIEQIQINQENKTSFLDALKAALRQDPDIMMIGEIRDRETADIALQAAMTGHLVLSTLHANNAPASLARLTEMGIEPYLLAGSINLIIGQRLVRKVCKTCLGKGCDNCHKTGYRGRMAIAEALVPGPEIENLITHRAPLRTFEDEARKLGMKTMYQDGMDKVAQGITTQEEVERVTKE